MPISGSQDVVGYRDLENRPQLRAGELVENGPGLAIRVASIPASGRRRLPRPGFSTTQNTVTVIGNDRVLTTSKFLPVNSVAAQALGALPLKPEKSLNYTLGFTAERGPARLTVDG